MAIAGWTPSSGASLILSSAAWVASQPAITRSRGPSTWPANVSRPPTCSPRINRVPPRCRESIPAMTQVVWFASAMRSRSGEATPGRYGALARRASRATRPRPAAAAASASPRPRTWSGAWRTSLCPVRSLSASRRRSSGHAMVERPSRCRTSKLRYTAGRSAAAAGPVAIRRPNPARSGRPSRSSTAITPSSTAPRPPLIDATADTSGKRRARSPPISPWIRTLPPGSR